MYQILLLWIFTGQIYVFTFHLLSHEAVVKFKTIKPQSVYLIKAETTGSHKSDSGYSVSWKPPPGMIHYSKRLLNMESILIESTGGNSPVCGQNAVVET